MSRLRHSIKFKFTFIFMGIMLLLLLLQCIANIGFLEKYYVNRKVDSLKRAFEKVNELVLTTEATGNTVADVIEEEFGQNLTDSKAISTIRQLNDTSNINLVMIDAHNKAVIAASREGDWLVKKLRFYLDNQEAIVNGTFPEFGMPGKREESGTGEEEEQPELEPSGPRMIYEGDGYYIQETYDFRSDMSYLECWGYFEDGETRFLMSMPIASIHDSVALTNRFMLAVGFFVLLIGSAAIYLAARETARPINQLASISKRMTALDFSARYTGREHDELGVLGASMNAMSETLEKTIAELKTSNNQLQQDIDEKTKIDAMRRDFIANVSHELKTPIALIEGYAEGLNEGMAEDAESRDYYCGVIMDEAIKMNRLIRQLTSLNNIEFGADHTEFARFDAAELIRNLAQSQRIALDEKGAKLVTELPDKAFVWADEYKIEEVITNYLTNALHHVDGQKRIILRAVFQELSAGAEKGAAVSPEKSDTASSAAPAVQAKVAGKKRVLLVSVYNDGAPIPQEDLPHIWEKFYKVDKARTRAYGGSGIGLSIVKAIMESHHQRCGVENQESGVLFWFTLDASDESKA